MKHYDVTLANKDCIFDACQTIKSAAEAVDFAMGRGGKYLVYVSSSDDPEYTIKATYYGSRDAFAVDTGFNDIFMTRDQFVSYLTKQL